MPTGEELRGLYQKGVGTRNIDPVFDMKGWRVWTPETGDLLTAWYFYFYYGNDVRGNCNYPNDLRGFAVRYRYRKKEPAQQKEQNVQDRFTKESNGIITDHTNNLEWYVGADKDTDWNEANKWVEGLNRNNFNDGRWRMPSRDELTKLYQKGVGKYNLVPLFKIDIRKKYLWVWTGEIKGSSSAWDFNFIYGNAFWDSCTRSYYNRVFAVRPR